MTTAAGRSLPATRLLRLHLTSRRVPTALLALAVCGAVLRAALTWHWDQGSGSAARQLSCLLEAGTAMVIAVATHSPFGEPERVSGRWLPWLRLGTAVLLGAAAVGALAAGAVAAHDTEGTLGVVRDVAGMTGIGLLCAAALGGLLAWIGPLAYAVVAETALVQSWSSPWIWVARPTGDRGAASCAALLLTAGLAAIAFRGARDPAGD